MSALNYVIKSAFEGQGVKAAMNSINQMEKKTASFSRSLNKMMGLMGGGAIGYGILRFAQDTLGAYNEQEKATARLNSALMTQGVYTEALSSKLHNQADEIQRVTTVGDEQSLGLMQLGLAMGVTTDKIGDATKGAIGLSKSFGVDLNAAMKMVALSQAGNYTLLNRYIPQLKEMTSETEKATLVNKLMADGFKMAEAEARTTGGQIEQFKNNIGELKEALGKHVAQIVDYWTPALQGVVKWLNEIFSTQQEKSTANLSRQEKELDGLDKQIMKFRELRDIQRDWTRREEWLSEGQYQKEADYYAKLIKARNELRKRMPAEAPAAPIKPGVAPVDDTAAAKAADKARSADIVYAANANLAIAEEAAKAKADADLKMDEWYLSEKGAAEMRYFESRHGMQGNFLALELEQKETLYRAAVELYNRDNASMTGSFLISLDRMKASGMGWAQAWDGMWSGTLSGMTANVQTFLTAGGNMFKNFSKLLDGIFKSIATAFISMVAQMIAKWVLMQMITGLSSGLALRVLGSFSKGGTIPETGPYLLHKGEEVIPADSAQAMRSGSGPSLIPAMAGGGDISLTQHINIGGTSETDISVVAQRLEEATRNGVMSAVNLSKVQYKVGLQRAGETAL